MKNYKNGDSEPSHDASLSSVVNLTAPDLEKVRNNEDAFETND